MKNKKLWGGAFNTATSELMDAFNASVNFDKELYSHDIQGSIAHAKMLAHCKIISKKDAVSIVRGLKEIEKEISSGQFQWKLELEDVHLNIESRLIQKIGDVGGKLHTARSRNDQVALDIRLYCREKIQATLHLIRDFQKALLEQCKKHIDCFLPGYTHLQRAQPVSLAHHLLAYFEMLERDKARLQDALKRVNVLPLGSGAIAGTRLGIDRSFVAKELKFDQISENSMDAVSDRDFIIEILNGLSLIMMHLSRLSEEWILWSSQEFQFIQLPQEYCTGSSMMPQKINPDALELIRGKTARVYGSLMTLLTLMKGTALTYNKDMQEDKEPLFDAFHTVQMSLVLIAKITAKAKFNSDKMLAANREGFVLATELADYLVSKGIPFRKSHRVVGELVQYCQSLKKTFEDLSLVEFQKINPIFSQDVFQILSIEAAIDKKTSYGGTSRSNIQKQIKRSALKIKD